MMSDSKIHLNLVLSENGEEPLVLACSWTGDANRESPALRNVRAKPRLRALCILLVLAKYCEKEAAKAALSFQAEIPKGTWIWTLTNDLEDVLAWIKTHFRISDDELFVSGNVGSTHNLGGSEYPRVAFHPDKLPLSNLHISRKSHLHNAPAQPLLRKDMISFALDLESKHRWAESAVDKLFPVAVGKSGRTTSGAKHVNTVVKAAPPDEKAILQARLSVEQELDVYQDGCKPFYTFLDKCIYNNKGNFWKKNRIDAFIDNVGYYTVFGNPPVEVLYWNTDRFFYREKLRPVFGDEIHDAERWVTFVLGRLTQKTDYDTAWGFSGISDSALILKETRDFIKAIHDNSKISNRFYVFGTIIALQRIHSDLMKAACHPFYYRILLDDERKEGAAKISSAIDGLRLGHFENMDLLRRHCRHQNDFLQVLQGMRAILKPQVDFLKALHARLA
jgi:hypothetical protein